MWDELVRSLDDAGRAELQTVLRTRRYAKGVVVFSEGDFGDALHVVAAGALLVERLTDQGDTVAVAVLGPGAVVGEQALIGEDRRGATVRALTEASTRSLARPVFQELRELHRQFDWFLVRMLDLRNREMYDLLLEARHHPAERRVRRCLVEVAAHFGDEIPLKQETIAALAGTTRPTANAVLRDIEACGVIELRRGRILVVDGLKLLDL